MKVLIDAGHLGYRESFTGKDVGSFIFATWEERGAYV